MLNDCQPSVGPVRGGEVGRNPTSQSPVSNRADSFSAKSDEDWADELASCAFNSGHAMRDKVRIIREQAALDEKRRADQLGVNCRWLIDKLDRIHRALCPGKSGTWQQRAEQAAAAAEHILTNPHEEIQDVRPKLGEVP